MSSLLYRYTFEPSVCREEIEAALLLAILATESLHGESDTRLNAGHSLDPTSSKVVIAADTAVGKDLNRVFVGFLRRELTEAEFQVERLVRLMDSAVPAPRSAVTCPDSSPAS